ncbi:MAG: GGDEF domain-containing protein [Cohaesibacteraceae bacterium]|nr:GGDEF domain-containing protein [Cohaesibacteraceae bacterium]
MNRLLLDPSIRDAHWIMRITLGVTLIMLVVLFSERFYLDSRIHQTMTDIRLVEQNTARVQRLSANMLMSVKLAASTRDLAWTKKYQSQQQQMIIALASVLKFATFDETALFEAAAVPANAILNQLSEKALRIAGKHNSEAALRVLTSEEYGAEQYRLESATNTLFKNVSTRLEGAHGSYVLFDRLFLLSLLMASLLGIFFLWNAILENIKQALSGYKGSRRANHNEPELDTMTQLRNRDSFQRRAGIMLEDARDSGVQVAMILIDFDQFQKVNDTYGRLVGDSVLCEAASRIGKSIRATDCKGRYGGDEFAIMACSVSEYHNPYIMADRLFRTMSKPFVVDGQELHLTVSIGSALVASGFMDFDELHHRTHLSLQRAKTMGRNTIVHYTEDLAIEALTRDEPQISGRPAA